MRDIYLLNFESDKIVWSLFDLFITYLIFYDSNYIDRTLVLMFLISK